MKLLGLQVPRCYTDYLHLAFRSGEYLYSLVMVAAHEELFAKARDEFLSTLAPEEHAQFSSCSSVQDVLGKITGIQNLTKAKRRVKPCLDKIKDLGDNLTPYFKIIEIFCASHPEWANLVLGALHLILKVCQLCFTPVSGKADYGGLLTWAYATFSWRAIS